MTPAQPPKVWVEPKLIYIYEHELVLIRKERDDYATGKAEAWAIIDKKEADLTRVRAELAEAVRLLAAEPQAALIWASPRELLNVFQADAVGCHIITVTPEILRKIDLVGKDLDELSLETVNMFFNDALKAGIALPGVGVR